MGTPRLGAVLGLEGTRQRIVSLRPFFLGRTEVTVGDFRAAPTGARPWTRSKPHCMFEETPDAFYDRMPMNCVNWHEARAYCIAVGRDLPTEAQFEYVAGGLRGYLFPWGDQPPTCRDAVYGRAGPIPAAADDGVKECYGLGEGPQLPGSGALDRVRVNGGEVLDLVGNLSEWVRDRYEPDDRNCWSPGVLFDPLCEPGPIDRRAYKGGEWTSGRLGMTAALRNGTAPTARSNGYGFRCARPGD
jgi:formylglycine-generating enzyme required for sulfatase activity